VKGLLFISLAIVLVLGLILVGCASSTPAPTTSAPKTTAPATSAAPTTSAPKTTAPATTSAPTPSTPAADQKTWNLRFHTDQNSTQAYTVNGNIPLFKMMEEATQGRVKVTPFYSATLGAQSDMPTSVKNNVAQFGYAMLGTFPGQYPLSEVIGLPFMATKAEDATKTLLKLYEEFPEIQAEYKGFKVVAIWTSDPYPLITVNKPVRVLDDIKGLKIRAAGTPTINMTKAVGATPLTIPMPDTYLALQKGTIDGMWTAHEAIVGFRQFEVTKYYTRLLSTVTPFMIIMNQETWNSFPPDIQKQLSTVFGDTASQLFAVKVFDASATNLAADVKRLGGDWPKEYITPSAAETEKFVTVGGKPVWDKWIDDWKSRGPTQKILDRAIELEKQFTK
jgi:TRAP-type C4-dicarboxylate transport system substrate-binding protein